MKRNTINRITKYDVIRTALNYYNGGEVSDNDYLNRILTKAFCLLVSEMMDKDDLFYSYLFSELHSLNQLVRFWEADIQLDYEGNYLIVIFAYDDYGIVSVEKQSDLWRLFNNARNRLYEQNILLKFNKTNKFTIPTGYGYSRWTSTPENIWG